VRLNDGFPSYFPPLILGHIMPFLNDIFVSALRLFNHCAAMVQPDL